MALKALILDVEGTIAESADVSRAAFNQTFEEFDLGWIWSRPLFHEIRQRAPVGQEINCFAATHRPVMLHALTTSGKLGDIEARQTEIYYNLLEAGAAPLRPGVARLMAEAKVRGLKLMLASTGPRTEYELILFNRFGMEMIDALPDSVGREDLANPTSLTAYAMALRRAGIAPQDAIAIDDSQMGVEAAARLGMPCIATPSIYTEVQDFRAAQLVISDLGHPAAPFAVYGGDAMGYNATSVDALLDWHMVAAHALVTAA